MHRLRHLRPDFVCSLGRYLVTEHSAEQRVDIESGDIRREVGFVVDPSQCKQAIVMRNRRCQVSTYHVSDDRNWRPPCNEIWI